MEVKFLAFRVGFFRKTQNLKTEKEKGKMFATNGKANKSKERKTGGMGTMKNRIWVHILVLVALLVLSGLQPMVAPVVARELEVNNLEVGKARVMEAYGQLPLAFIPNQGQVNEQVSYYTQSGGQSLWFTTNGMTMVLPEATLHLEFLDINPSVQMEGGDKLAGVVNYFIGNDPAKWKRNIPTYGSVIYYDLWSGVNLAYEGQPGVLKSTFTIAPGTDSAQISLAYPDADSLSVDQEGNLIISDAGEEIQESTPLAWQEVNGQRVPVTVTYQVEGQSYGFALPEGYDPAYPLVVDPQLVYSTFLGGSGYDYGYGIAVDNTGNAYVAGSTGSISFSDFPITAGAFDTSYNGVCDAFVTKVNASGTGLVYATFLGGSGYDEAYAIAVDEVGNAYVAGFTFSSDFPVTMEVFDTSYNGSSDVFVAKLNAGGTGLDYSTFVGGGADDCRWNCALAIDGTGNAYVAGETKSSNFPTTPGAYDETYNGGIDDAFVVKLNAEGTGLAYATFLGGNNEDCSSQWSGAITVDSFGSAYITGETTSSDFPTTPGAFDTNLGFKDAFVVKLNAAGSGLIYSTLLGGSSDEDSGTAIAVDRGGSAYVTGYTRSSDFPTTPGAFDTSYSGLLYDAFVVKLNVSGTNLVYATFLGGSNYDRGCGIAIDGLGNVYLAGTTHSLDFPTTLGAFDTTWNGNSDAFVVELNIAGTELTYATFLGGVEYEDVYAIAIDGTGNAYMTGKTQSSDFPTTTAVFDTTHNGGIDAFVAKLYLGPGTTPPFLDLPVSYSNFSQSAQGNEDGKGPGRVNSWFDHTYPTYTSPPNAGTNNITKWDGEPIPIDPNMSEEEFKRGIGVWWYDGHDGLDFSQSYPGEPVFAAAAGTIDDANTGGGCLGWHVTIDHGNGYKTIYGHLRDEPTVTGNVNAGDPIGIIGNTFESPCSSKGAHLHFEVQFNNTTVDPYGWNEVRAGTPDPWSPASVYLWKYLLWEKKGVDSAGATLTSPAGNKQAVIPPGALSSLVTVELWDAPVASPSASLRSLGQSFWLRVLEWLSGGGMSASSEVTAVGFTLPVTLTVTYGVTETRHLDITQLGIYKWSGSDWVGLPTTLEPGSATAQTTQVGEFDLQAPLLCLADQSEPDDSYYVASVVSTDGTGVSRLFDIADDEDWLKFTAQVGKIYELSTSSLAAGVDTLIELYDLDGVTLLASDDNSGSGAASRLEWQAPLDGTYFLRVVPAGGSASSCDASYELSVTEKTEGGNIYLPIILKNHP